MLLCVICPFRSALLVVSEDILQYVVGKISEPLNVDCECCLIWLAMFLIWVPYQLVQCHVYMHSDWLPVE